MGPQEHGEPTVLMSGWRVDVLSVLHRLCVRVMGRATPGAEELGGRVELIGASDRASCTYRWCLTARRNGVEEGKWGDCLLLVAGGRPCKWRPRHTLFRLPVPVTTLALRHSVLYCPPRSPW